MQVHEHLVIFADALYSNFNTKSLHEKELREVKQFYEYLIIAFIILHFGDALRDVKQVTNMQLDLCFIFAFFVTIIISIITFIGAFIFVAITHSQIGQEGQGG